MLSRFCQKNIAVVELWLIIYFIKFNDAEKNKTNVSPYYIDAVKDSGMQWQFTNINM